ncbi:iron-sulfur cluster assembly scaffold protein [Marinicauda algicola]|uniref:Iron-sulfur cluster assembly scaffold protein n=1 Tax=Marinicauda algicola TaxID=2029849 RepID=A0A4S2H5C5_9PROT|nr:iron-sulfur cluster assembly scaffold protein [Marinicauda algicola]TGY90502.1 iron-sulfur cluster assembly scaffold protein [Marinicauda algicola]
MTTHPYSSEVLQLAADIPRIGRLPAPHASARKVSRLCGSSLDLDLCVEDGRISDLALELEACALGQAAASVLARDGVGATPAEIRAAREALKAMLKEGRSFPEGRFAALAALAPAKDYPARHGSVMLAFDAACAALDALEANA